MDAAGTLLESGRSILSAVTYPTPGYGHGISDPKSNVWWIGYDINDLGSSVLWTGHDINDLRSSVWWTGHGISNPRSNAWWNSNAISGTETGVWRTAMSLATVPVLIPNQFNPEERGTGWMTIRKPGAWNHPTTLMVI